MYCGSCLRDNQLTKELRRQGHDVLLVPLYLPLKTDTADESKGVPVFFGGVNVYLQQKSSIFRKAPKALDRLLDSPTLLNFVAGFAAKTRPEELGALTVSMLKGEHGAQAKELEHLIDFLKSFRPDLVVLSNALLAGLARRIQAALGVAVVCTIAGEDTFLDHLPDPFAKQAWDELRLRAAEMDRILAVSRYYADLMRGRLGVPDERMAVVLNGITVAGFPTPEKTPAAPTLGYFARLCADKGLGTLVDAWLLLKKRGKIAGLKLKAGGTMTPPDEKYVAAQKEKIRAAGFEADAEFHPNLDLDQKHAFFKDLSVFSAPATYGESFGLYVVEALASGVPVVQPRHGAFPELLGETGGGIICEPDDAESLANGLEPLLLDPEKARTLGAAGRARVLERFTVERMAKDVLAVYEAVVRERSALKTE
ncbi:MAG: glycosyltransferase family 4 protein [Planctomycetota bacterium]|nr:glycosyltransferase family 4 protein [Planctomycetota bacterium]